MAGHYPKSGHFTTFRGSFFLKIFLLIRGGEFPRVLLLCGNSVMWLKSSYTLVRKLT